MNFFDFEKNNFHIAFKLDEYQRIYISQYSTHKNENYHEWFPLIQVHASGFNQNDHHARKHTGSEPGSSLRYVSHAFSETQWGTRLDIFLQCEELSARWYLQHIEGLSSVRIWCDVTNISGADIGLEYVSSIALFGIASTPWQETSLLHIPHNNWYGEAQWKSNTLPSLGLDKVNRFSLDRIQVESTGTWSSIGHLPCAVFEDVAAGVSLLWQIEHNGSWQWEIGEVRDQLYLQVSGPNENENHWWKSLAPGETFTSVPVALSLVEGSLQEALQEITRYRRKIIRPSEDNKQLPVIFNDYMNCLSGDPTTNKLLPLIDAAAEAGCEYFCIDCGWYSDGPWWNGVGEWLPSSKRFPDGIHVPLRHIINSGMKPGLWLELEVMGINCQLAHDLPDECFFIKHGKRVIDHQRYQLDFRHPLVRKHADQVIARLVNEYGVHYIKMDYNINAGIGTEHDADSLGDGLLQHNRAYLHWLKETMDSYPHLVIENCGSGGLRMDYSLLQLHSIQSVTDQTDYKLMACIAAASASAVTPEQAAIWSYPLREGDREEVVVNMVNSMLLRIHQSGHLAELSPERFSLVKEGIDIYKQYRQKIPFMLPFWPLGMPTFDSSWLAFGLRDGNEILLSVWRLNSEGNDIMLPISGFSGHEVSVECIYPNFDESNFYWDSQSQAAMFELKNKFTARLFKVSSKKQ